MPRLDAAIDADDFALDRQRSGKMQFEVEKSMSSKFAVSNDLDADCNGDAQIQLEEIIQVR